MFPCQVMLLYNQIDVFRASEWIFPSIGIANINHIQTALDDVKTTMCAQKGGVKASFKRQERLDKTIDGGPATDWSRQVVY